MDPMNYKLFDEEIVRNILLTAGISIFDFMKEKPSADIKDICDYINQGADRFIRETVENMRGFEEDSPPEEFGEQGGTW